MANSDEVCQNCIWWLGDNSGDQGECLNDEADDSRLIMGRFEDCINILVREVNTDTEPQELDALDFS